MLKCQAVKVAIFHTQKDTQSHTQSFSLLSNIEKCFSTVSSGLEQPCVPPHVHHSGPKKDQGPRMRMPLKPSRAFISSFRLNNKNDDEHEVEDEGRRLANGNEDEYADEF